MVSATAIEPAAADQASAAVWQILNTVPDPEIPVISICDLGIVRDVKTGGDATHRTADIVITPTYSGCPAMQMIEQDIRSRLAAAGFATVRITTTFSPAWSTDWINDDALARLREYGIAPPGKTGGDTAVVRFVSRRHAGPACPQCGSIETERLSEFGSTACKAMYRCLECREPFDYFKPI